ncbi:MAG: hypothetical protein COA92_03215 [Sulfurovum sp.]|nr:MAG: hypothetical protein COA92_03215 [Sulfurovum sp.]
MPHYNITIINKQKENNSLLHAFKSEIKVLLLHSFRNIIKNEDGYTIVFNKEKKNMQISTEILIEM